MMMDENLPIIVGSALCGSSLASFLWGCRNRWCAPAKQRRARSTVRPVKITNCEDIAEAFYRRLGIEQELIVAPPKASANPETECPNEPAEVTFFVSAQFLIDSYRSLLADGERHGRF